MQHNTQHALDKQAQTLASLVKTTLMISSGVALIIACVLLNMTRLALAVAAFCVIFRIGFMLLRGLSSPAEEPPEPGQLRKVKIHYRCSICGTEVRMTIAPDEDPEPPKHCQDEMDLIAPIE